jgi:NF-kappa-B inhibitor-like protein 2
MQSVLLINILHTLCQGHPVNVQDNSGWIPLHEAANNNWYDITEYLLKHGADINHRGGPKCQGMTPLIDAASVGWLDIVELLLKYGANALAKDDHVSNLIKLFISYKVFSLTIQIIWRAIVPNLVLLSHSGQDFACKLVSAIPQGMSLNFTHLFPVIIKHDLHRSYTVQIISCAVCYGRSCFYKNCIIEKQTYFTANK